MKKVLVFLLALPFVFTTGNAQIFQSPRIALGLGAVHSVNESPMGDRDLNFSAGLFYRHPLAKSFTGEINLAYLQNSGKSSYYSQDWSTNLFQFDARALYHPFIIKNWMPYITLGVGGLNFSADKYSEIANRVYNDPVAQEKFEKAEKSGLTGVFLAGLGTEYRLSGDLSLDFQVTYNASFTDDIMGEHDAQYTDESNIVDGYWNFRLGLAWAPFPYSGDTDSDGLSDDYEKQIGTDPNKNDTDGDGLMDGEELDKWGTDPKLYDTDGDGIKDGSEVLQGTNPTDPTDNIKFGANVGDFFVLEGIEFETAKSNILPSSEKILMKAYRALKEYPEVNVEIQGHTDNTGDRDLNMKLSLDRAESVKNWMVRMGIAPERMTTKGLGPDKPAASNETPEGRQKNRRIEFLRTK